MSKKEAVVVGGAVIVNLLGKSESGVIIDNSGPFKPRKWLEH